MALTPGGGAVFLLAARHPRKQERGQRAATRQGPGRMTATARDEAPRRVRTGAPSSGAALRRPRGMLPELARWLPRRLLTEPDGLAPRRLIPELDVEPPRRMLSEREEHQPCRMLPEIDGGLPRRALPEWENDRSRKGWSGPAGSGHRQPRRMLPERDEVRPRRMLPEIDEVRPRRMAPDSDATRPRRMIPELALVPPRRMLAGFDQGSRTGRKAHRNLSAS